MVKLRIPLPRQYNLGNLPGAFIYLYGNASGVIGILSTFMGAGTFFMVFVLHFIPTAQVWQFYILLALMFPIIMILVYMFVTPSVIAISNLQGWKHENPWREDLKQIKADQKLLKEQLGRIEKALGIEEE